MLLSIYNNFKEVRFLNVLFLIFDILLWNSSLYVKEIFCVKFLNFGVELLK